MVSGYNRNSLRLVKLPVTPNLSSKTPVVRIILTDEQDSLLVRNKQTIVDEVDWNDDSDDSDSSDSSDSGEDEERRVIRRYNVFSVADDLLRKIEEEDIVDYTRVERHPSGRFLAITWDKELPDYAQIKFHLEINNRLQMAISSSVEMPMDINRQIEVTKQFATSLLLLGSQMIAGPLRNSGKPLASLNRTLRGVRNRNTPIRTVMNNPNLARVLRSHLRNTGRNYNRDNGRNRNLGHLKEHFRAVKRIMDDFETRMRMQIPYYDAFLNEVVFE